MAISYCDRCSRVYAKPGVIRTKSDSLIPGLMKYVDAKSQEDKFKMLTLVYALAYIKNVTQSPLRLRSLGDC
jgi:hypothetical protein